MDVGARLVLGKGRHCEIAAVAAAGSEGLAASDVVEARRAYAKHLGVSLGGKVSNGPTANHVEHALENHSRNSDAKSRICLGESRAVRLGSRYAIRFPQRKPSARSAVD